MERKSKTNSFWQKLKIACKRNKMTTRALCEKAGVRYETVVRQHGEDRLPTASQLLVFSRILGTSIDYLLADVVSDCECSCNNNTTLSQLVEKVFMLSANEQEYLNRMLK